MGKIVNFMIYLTSGLLLVSYFLVLYTSINPRVCTEYKLYYIDKELQDWPGCRNLEYRLGTKETFVFGDDNRTKRRGNSWNSFEEDGCWTYGEHASILFTHIKKENLILELLIQDIRMGATVIVSVAENEIGVINDAGTYRFEIPSEVLQDDILEIDFIISNYGSIDGDARSQGVKVKEIVLYEAD